MKQYEYIAVTFKNVSDSDKLSVKLNKYGCLPVPVVFREIVC